MSKIKKEPEGYNRLKKALVILIAIILLVVVTALSYGIVTGIVYALCWCFGLSFSLRISTGIWILLVLINALFRKK